MKWVLFMILMMPILLWNRATSDDEALQTKLRNELKDALDVATHNAALQVMHDDGAAGTIIFSDTAYTVLVETLQQRIGLDADLKPIAPNIWKDSISIVWFDKVESGVFPRTYNSGAPYYYMDTLNGPSIVAIVKVPHPRYYGVSDKIDYIVGSSHEYVP